MMNCVGSLIYNNDNKPTAAKYPLPPKAADFASTICRVIQIYAMLTPTTIVYSLITSQCQHLIPYCWEREKKKGSWKKFPTSVAPMSR